MQKKSADESRGQRVLRRRFRQRNRARILHSLCRKNDTATGKSPREIAIDSLQALIRRIAEGKPENVGVRGAESTITAITGRMAIDQRREITWELMRS